MDLSRKEFKTLSMAQPIKKDIDQTLTKLQAEKRRYLSMQREEAILRQELLRVRRQLNEAKLLQPKTRIKQNKNVQTNMSINNTERMYLNTINNISEIKTKIDVHRKQIDKYKRLAHGVVQELNVLKEENNYLQANLLREQQKNERTKISLLDYRTLNMRNTDQFKSSFNALHRTSTREDNQRKKSQVMRKSFNHQQLKNSNMIHLSEIEQQQQKQEQVNKIQDIKMTNSIPLVKQRIRILLHNNKQRIKISQNYRKFGEQLEQMFTIMKEYKGRDDVLFIAEEFVMKEKQLKKIQEYIGKLENRLMWYRNEIQKIKSSDARLIEQLVQQQNQQIKLNQKNYLHLQQELSRSIELLRHKETENIKWFEKIGQIIAPLVKDQPINRANFDKVLGMIEEKFFNEETRPISEIKDEQLNKSPTRAALTPSIDQRQLKNMYSMELLSYEKLKEYAKDFITTKK